MPGFNITVEPTNNENIVKFVANSFIVKDQSYEFNNIDDAKPSPIAQKLFYLPFVKTVYLSQNFIAIEKYDSKDSIISWEDVQDEIADSITEYLNSGKPVIINGDTAKKIPLTIYAESTPNPSVMKFVSNKPLVNGTFEFKNIDETEHSPLAKALFKFSYIKEVFISANYVSISKIPKSEWMDITNELREFIRTYIENGEKILNDEIIQQNKKTSSVLKSPADKTGKMEEKPLTEIDKEIIFILDEYVKPAVAADGGNIVFESYDKNTKTVKVILQGACSGCPSSIITLKNGIETMLREMLHGKVTTVEAING